MATRYSLWPRRALMGLVRGYRLLLSPWLGSSCRFEPSCSTYALQALDAHGAAVGTYLIAHRILRCNPLCAAGHDPVPAQPPALFRHLVAAARTAAPSPSPTSSSKPNP